MKLEGARIGFLGDSITQGVGVTCEANTFHQLIGVEQKLGWAHNFGISATRIARQEGNSDWHPADLDFCLRSAVIPNDLDAVVIFGGTNDYGHGEATFGEKDSFDVYTFYGALNTLFTHFKEKAPNTKVIFMTPLHRLNENNPSFPEGKVLKDYVDAIKEIAANYDVHIIDLFDELDLDPADTELVPDGLHPSDKGHRVMADFITKKLLEI